jgi:ABC-2 type transport system ATP-binding protein
MLLGLVRPTSGGGTIFGEPLDKPQRSLKEAGALIEAPAFYPALSARDNLRVLARLGGIEVDLDSILDRVGLLDRSRDKVRAFSLGMKQRLAVAFALLSDPRLLILDEPTNGLDPEGIAEIRMLLRSLASEGRTVLVSSHLLAEIEQVCDHIVVIRSGMLLFEGEVTDLIASTKPQLRIRPEDLGDLSTLVELVRSTGIEVTSSDGGLVANGAEREAALLNRLAMSSGITLVQLQAVHATLEDAFFDLTETSIDRSSGPAVVPSTAGSTT